MPEGALVIEVDGTGPSRDSFQFACEEMFGVDLHAGPGSVLSITAVPLTQWPVARVENRGAPIWAQRSPERISRDHRPEGVVLGVCLDGGVQVSDEHESMAARPGDMLVAHTDAQHGSLLAASTRLGLVVLPVPMVRDVLGTSLAPPRPLLLERRGMAAVLSRFLSSLFEELPLVSTEQWNALLRPTIHLLASAVDERPDVAEVAQASARELHRMRVLRFIDAHLHDPRLRPGWIADQLRLSPRYLHLLFEGSGESVGAAILVRRLERCRTALADPRRAHQSVSEIAFACGFNDASHFSRAFRRRFGTSPRDVRQTPI